MMSSLHQIFPFNNQLVKRFLNWKQGDEEDNWRNKAIEALIKKLKRQPNDQYTTLQLVLDRKSEQTPCITLSRSQDGRLQVSHRKMLPHVMYCRIFRWPDLQSQHELRSLPTCSYPAGRRESRICVNPYHYSRVEHSIYPPVVTARSSEFTASPPVSPSCSHTTQGTYFTPVPQPAHHQDPNDQFGCHQQQLGYYNQPLSEPSWYSGEAPTPMPESPLPPYSMLMNTTDDANPASPDEGHEIWCKITYFELGNRVGEPFRGSSPKVIVDGFTEPSSHNRRFSLGLLSNINRNSTIEQTRCAIRRGVCLENQDSQIYVTNLSDASIFFQSKNINVENQLNQHAVIKIEPQRREKIFDQKVFADLVQEAIRSQDGKSYERLFSLTEHCMIKMSFVKGWGSIYLRQDVTSTPCWIEIHLLKPYAVIDQYLSQVGPPSYQVTSTS